MLSRALLHGLGGIVAGCSVVMLSVVPDCAVFFRVGAFSVEKLPGVWPKCLVDRQRLNAVWDRS